MSRPPQHRRIAAPPRCGLFKPAGIPASTLEESLLTVDEFEALRLADAEGLYQEQAAERMGVSRQTFQRIVTAARHKVADALVHGKALRIVGGAIRFADARTFGCFACGATWSVPFGVPRPDACPQCASPDLRRMPDDAPGGGGGSWGGHHGRGRHGRGRCGPP